LLYVNQYFQIRLPNHTFVLIFDQFERTNKAVVDFLFDIIYNFPSKFYVVLSLSVEEEIDDGTSYNRKYEDITKLSTGLDSNEIHLTGLSEEEIGTWINKFSGLELPLVPDLRRIKEYTMGIPIVINEWMKHSNILDYKDLSKSNITDTLNRLCSHIYKKNFLNMITLQKKI